MSAGGDMLLGNAGSWQPGDLVAARGREWVVEQVDLPADPNELGTVSLACISDDAQGEQLWAVLDSEIDCPRQGLR